ncbi:hypothetical protein WA588_001856 [Blastocystis sp. NMH]
MKLQTIKILLLVFLTCLTTVQVTVMRYSRIVSPTKYIVSTTVILSEGLKVLCCIVFYCREEGFVRGIKIIIQEVFIKWRRTLLLFVPAFLYAIQNNLLLVAITNLDSAIYSVTYQMKILTTALFSVFLLHKHLSLRKWIALIIIVPGVGLVELSSKSATMKMNTTAQDPLLGFICIVICSLTSGFAGVFFEMVLKGKTKSNIWIQSIQLCLATCFFCCLNAMTKDLPRIRDEGFFTGYNVYTWITIFLNGLSGVVIAAVVNYTDNIVKGLSSCLSMVLSCIVSRFVFGFKFTGNFLVGATLVFVALILYNFNGTPVKNEKV